MRMLLAVAVAIAAGWGAASSAERSTGQSTLAPCQVSLPFTSR
jgi:hypothetical protein